MLSPAQVSETPISLESPDLGWPGENSPLPTSLQTKCHPAPPCTFSDDPKPQPSDVPLPENPRNDMGGEDWGCSDVTLSPGVCGR